MNPCHALALALAVVSLTSQATAQTPAQDVDGWKTILATKDALKDYPEAQASLEDGLLHVRQGNGVLIPQPGPDGAIRARFHFRERTGFPQLRIRRNGNGRVGTADYYEVILFMKPGQTSVKEGYVNVTTRGKGRRIGVVPLPEPFVLGASMDMEVSIVGAHLKVLVNGKVAFEVNDSTLSTGGYWGVAALDAWFSNLQVRSLLPQSTNPRVAQLEEAYEAAIQRDIVQARAEAVAALDATYLAALDRALEATTQAADLDTALSLRAEKERVTKGAPLPHDDSAAPPALKPLRATYRTSRSQRESAFEQRRPPLRDTFLQAMLAYEEELTRAKDLNAALEVRKRREFEAAKARP